MRPKDAFARLWVFAKDSGLGLSTSRAVLTRIGFESLLLRRDSTS
jgi:hypothetical protein